MYGTKGWVVLWLAVLQTISHFASSPVQGALQFTFTDSWLTVSVIATNSSSSSAVDDGGAHNQSSTKSADLLVMPWNVSSKMISLGDLQSSQNLSQLLDSGRDHSLFFVYEWLLFQNGSLLPDFSPSSDDGNNGGGGGSSSSGRIGPYSFPRAARWSANKTTLAVQYSSRYAKMG